MKTMLFLLVLFACAFSDAARAPSQAVESAGPDTLCGRPAIRDSEGRLLCRYLPEVPGAGYAHVARPASEFIKSGTPIDPVTGEKIYFISCCFQGPHMRGQDEFDRGVTWEEWMHNPACVWAGLVQGLVLDYRVFSGDNGYVDVAGEMLDFQLQHGTTPAGWPWPGSWFSDGYGDYIRHFMEGLAAVPEWAPAGTGRNPEDQP